MAQPKIYMVVTELDCIGYIVGFYKSLSKAKKVSKELYEKYEVQHKGKGYELFEKTMKCKTYKVHPTLKYSVIQTASECCSNGVYSVSIICTDRDGFSLQQFMFDRGNTIYLFDVEDYDEDKCNFVKFCPDFIAN